MKQYGWILGVLGTLGLFSCANDQVENRKAGAVNVIPISEEPKVVEEPGASQKVAPIPVKIDRVVYHYSTYDTSQVGYPSNGPGDDYVLSAANHPEFDQLITKVLDETKVNDAVTLRKYLELAMAGEKEEVQRIDGIAPRYRAPSGSGVNKSFGLYFGDMRIYEFEPDLRRYSGEHVRALYKITTDPKNKVAAESDDPSLPPLPN